MATIGERLEEARKKLGVSINDAAAATKIRAEYLTSIEKSAGADIPLQEVYIRGFLKNYAKFLKLDYARLLADFDAVRRSQTNAAPAEAAKADRELIGRLELASPLPPQPELATEEEVKNSAIEASTASAGESKPLESIKSSFSTLPKWVVPAVAGVLGLLLLAGMIVGVASAFNSSSSSAEGSKTLVELSVKFTALNDVTMIAKDVASQTNLYAGTLKKGASIPVKNKGAILLKYSDGPSLQVERDGKTTLAGPSGAGKCTIE
jgi:cytoskeleton protein RodZ